MINSWKNVQILTYAMFCSFIYIFAKRNIVCLYDTHVDRYTDSYRKKFKLSAYKYLQNLIFLSNWKHTILIVVSKAEFVSYCSKILLFVVFSYILLRILQSAITRRSK